MHFYGFAHELTIDNTKYDYHCHHGEEECKVSYYLNCAQSIYNKEKSILYTICLEN